MKTGIKNIYPKISKMETGIMNIYPRLEAALLWDGNRINV